MSCTLDTNVANFGFEEGELGKLGIKTYSASHGPLLPPVVSPGRHHSGGCLGPEGTLTLLQPTGIHYFQCPARPDLKCIL